MAKSLLAGIAAITLVLLSGQKASDTPDAKAADPDGRYSYQEEHDRFGIGKFYMGREIARVMSHRGISWLERDTRQEEENLTKLIELLDLKSGETVADIGAGSGVITFMMAEKVGDEGTVYAVDIQPEMLDAIRTKAEKLGVDNVELVQGETDDPKLPPGSTDLAVMVDVYHEFDVPFEMLSAIVDGLKIGGRVAFVEYRKEDPAIPILEVHKMTEEQVKREAAALDGRLKFIETKTELPRQHVILFERVK